MKRTILQAAFAALSLGIGGSAMAGEAADSGMAMNHKTAKTDQQLIENAMKAAPAAVAAKAKIVAMTADGGLRTLRERSNGYTCMPDGGAAPGPDAMCADGPAMKWLAAYIAHKTPEPNAVGFIYMLAGGTDSSNTDPFAAKPASGSDWIRTGPHVMIVGADASFYQAYPGAPNPDVSVPYVMWPGTPYQHLMAPSQ